MTAHEASIEMATLSVKRAEAILHHADAAYQRAARCAAGVVSAQELDDLRLRAVLADIVVVEKLKLQASTERTQ